MDLNARMILAGDLAQRAGALALHHFHHRDALQVEAKRNPQDMVSDADRAVETLIRDALTQAFPDDALLGEEYGLTPGTSGLTWLIDPIDGTAPFLAGLPGWCVSIGAVDAAGPVIGVICAPVLAETFVARRGHGATLNGTPIATAETLHLTTGLFGVGANDRVDPAKVGHMMTDLTAAGASWVRYGSGALMLAWVAAGRLVGYAEPRMSAWDCTAGYCLIEAAGGRTLPFPTGPDLTRPAPVLGTTRNCYDRALTLTRLDDDAHWG